VQVTKILGNDELSLDLDQRAARVAQEVAKLFLEKWAWPSAMLLGTETAALLNWLANP